MLLTWQHLGKSKECRLVSNVARCKQKRCLFLVQTRQFSLELFVIRRVAGYVARSTGTDAMFMHRVTVTPSCRLLYYINVTVIFLVHLETSYLKQVNLNISTTWFLLNLVTTHVLHLLSLLLFHLPNPLWKSLIALFSMLHLAYGTNSPLIFASLVRHSLHHFHLSHMVVHHHPLHHLHDHHLHLLLLVQSFTLNLRRGSSANHFLHRPSPFLPDWFHGLWDLVFILLNSWICLHGVLD